MRPSALSLALFAAAARALNIISGNDDGWAEVNIRELFYALTDAGHDVVISAPAEDESGSGSSTGTAGVLTEPCEFDSCATGSPAEGSNSTMPQWNYVNS
jgi:broad specificity polyphosphatase/5'/3'-nucleotidase SurE